MSGVIQYASMLINLKELQSITDPIVMLEKLKQYIVPMLILMLISLLFTTVMHYYILQKPIDPEQNILRCILKSARYFVPYLIICVILMFAGSIAILLGLMALIVGVFFSIVYIAMVALFILPVMMVEKNNIDKTIARTIKLAHTGFWSNMGWTAVFLILYIIVSLVLSGLVLIPFAGNFIKTFANPQDTSNIINLPSNPLFLFLSSAVNALTLPLFPIFAYILYFNGKAREDDINLPVGVDDKENRVRVEDLYAKSRNEENK
jgi:hypothetical protein